MIWQIGNLRILMRLWLKVNTNNIDFHKMFSVKQNGQAHSVAK